MLTLKNIRIPVRLTIAFAILLLLTMVVGGIGIRNARILSGITSEFHDQPFAVADDMSKVRVAYRTMLIASRDAVLADTPEQLEAAKREAKQDAEIYVGSLLAARAAFSGEKELFDLSLATFDEFKQTTDEIIAKAKDGDRAGALVLLRGKASEITEKNSQANIALFKASDRLAADFMEQARSRVAMVELFGIILLGVAVLVGAFVGFVTSCSITGPVNNARLCMEELTAGNLSVPVPGVDRGDELGLMARSIAVFKEELLRIRQMEDAQKVMEAQAEEQRRQEMRIVADNFETQFGSVVQKVILAVRDLRTAAQDMASTAARSSAQTSMVAAAAEDASGNVQAVSTATEEFSASVSEITHLVERSQHVAIRADGQAKQTSSLIRTLSENVAGIGEIVALINDIAGQTNLPAFVLRISRSLRCLAQCRASFTRVLPGILMS